MKTITLPAHNRPHYLRQTVESLSKLNLTGFKLFVNLEPGCKENVDIITAIDFVDVDLQINSEKLGVRGNPFNLIDRTFAAGSEWNYHIEDDMIFSPDTMDLVNWYKDNQEDNIIIYGTCRRANPIDGQPDNALLVGNYFSGLGWCCSKETWDNILKPIWFIPSPLGPYMHEGWDWNFSRLLKQGDYFEIVPVTTRTNTIGEFGTYSSPQSHAMFKKLKMAKSTETKEFFIGVDNVRNS